MSLNDLIRRPEGSDELLSPQQLVARYRRFREVSQRLSAEMVHRLGIDVLQEGARKLGLLRNGVFVFDNEQEMAVLQDYCIFHARRNGRNAVEQYWVDDPPRPGTDEFFCLNAMRNAIHSLFRIDEIERGVALAVTDLATDDRFLLVDIGLSQSAEPNLVLLSNLLLFDDFAATSGAALVAGLLPAEESAAFSSRWKRVSTSREPDYDPAPLIREFLQKKVTDYMRFADLPSTSLPDPHLHHAARKERQAMLQRRSDHKAGPTRRCPCGSGKMFKNCCSKKPH